MAFASRPLVLGGEIKGHVGRCRKQISSGTLPFDELHFTKSQVDARAGDFHDEKRSNETHASTTDPDARLYRKGSSQAAKLSYMGHALMENRHGLVVGATLTPATGTAEREAAIKMIVRRSPGARRLTLGADKGYDTKNFVADLRELNIAPHVAQNTTNRASAIDGRTTRHPGYAVSQIIRKRIEESFAWTKTIAGLHKTKHRGVGRVAFQFVFAMTAYNLIRMPRLLSTAA